MPPLPPGLLVPPLMKKIQGCPRPRLEAGPRPPIPTAGTRTPRS